MTIRTWAILAVIAFVATAFALVFAAEPAYTTPQVAYQPECREPKFRKALTAAEARGECKSHNPKRVQPE